MTTLQVEKRTLCRATSIVNGLEFICNKRAHDEEPVRNGVFQDTVLNADKHVFVRRYPVGAH